MKRGKRCLEIAVRDVEAIDVSRESRWFFLE
jgi:hypothetical protein